MTGASAEQIASARAKLDKLAAQCSSETRSESPIGDSLPIGNRPQPGEVEERSLGDVSVEGRTVHGKIPYSVASRDLGGWREVIEPGSLRNADLSDLVLTINHSDGVPLGRFPGTISLAGLGRRHALELHAARRARRRSRSNR